MWQRPSLCWCGTQMWCRGHWFRSVYQQHPTRTRVSGWKLGFVANLVDFLPLQWLKVGIWTGRNARHVKKASRIVRFLWGFWHIFSPLRWGFIRLGVLWGESMKGTPTPNFWGKTRKTTTTKLHALSISWAFLCISSWFLLLDTFFVCLLLRQKLAERGFHPKTYRRRSFQCFELMPDSPSQSYIRWSWTVKWCCFQGLQQAVECITSSG